MHELILYTTVGCHLCELAKNLLNETLENAVVTEIDIKSSPSLLAQYGTVIPVLKKENTCHYLAWPFSEAEVRQYVAL